MSEPALPSLEARVQEFQLITRLLLADLKSLSVLTQPIIEVVN